MSSVELSEAKQPRRKVDILGKLAAALLVLLSNPFKLIKLAIFLLLEALFPSDGGRMYQDETLIIPMTIINDVVIKIRRISTLGLSMYYCSVCVWNS